MKKLEEIAETDEERNAIVNLVADVRKFTANALKGISSIKKSRYENFKKVGAMDIQKSLDLQKKLYDSMFELFERMHRIVDYPSFVILEDELKKSYSKK